MRIERMKREKTSELNVKLSSEIVHRLQHFGSISGVSALSPAVSLISSTSTLFTSSPVTPQRNRSLSLSLSMCDLESLIRSSLSKTL
ncbi:hypothetical protein TorRG33x02_157870 [Trema orientale]|uniref:Uncharacterized protein n=1 Tax=Trema orientale TaxID=63057 RepID=A0A2P5ESA0_TREOI|nr:hypothetical protein TorRG33x02_157870 [Trema orientale]